MNRLDYEMTEEDYEKLVEASQPVMLIALQCGMPSSPQENANRAWKELGDKMGFDYMTAQSKGGRLFSAVSKPIEIT